MEQYRETYEENYVGKIIKYSYDGKQMFVAAVVLPQRTARQHAA